MSSSSPATHSSTSTFCEDVCVPADRSWPNHKDEQLARYLADRTGIMSFYNLVLVWVLAGRNDVFLWVTGWSFCKSAHELD